jgi:pimeloyl-ACP methyl ester carboxylesterase
MRTMYNKRKLTLNIGQTKRYQHQPKEWRTLLFIGLTVLLLLSLFRPWGIKRLRSDPHPVKSYAAAVAQIEKLRSQAPPNLTPAGKLLFLTQGHRTKRVIVFIHGYSNCPRQFKQLGACFFALGYNVLSAPLPHHGLTDRMNTEHAQLTAEELLGYGDQMVDIARGLGEQVVLVGLSVGGNVTAWEAQTRADLNLAVVMAPVFGYQQIPLWLTPAVTNLCLIAPNFFQWWDPVLKTAAGVPHSYPRFASRALAQSLRLGYAVQAQARRQSPAARRILLVTNANDPSVPKTPIVALAKHWREHGAYLRTYEFPANWRLGHDFIDPEQPDANINAVYPRLVKLITQYQDFK